MIQTGMCRCYLIQQVFNMGRSDFYLDTVIHCLVFSRLPRYFEMINSFRAK